MSTLSGILSTAKTAILTHQAAVQVTSHNITNAQTAGYSRQRPTLATNWAMRTPDGNIGTGVRLADVGRARDVLADQAVRRESGKASGFDTRRDLMGRVEEIFGEPSEFGISSTLDRFWGAWGDLANAPTSDNARSMVRQRGEQVTHALHSASERLNEVEADVRVMVSDTIGELNNLAKQLADVNQQILISEAGGKTAGDLRDIRDTLVDSVAKIGHTRVVVQNNGSYAVTIDGSPLVEGPSYQTFSSNMSPGGQIVLRSNGQEVSFPREGSRLGEMMRFLNEDVVETRAGLDALARGLVQTVNDIHEQGWTATGAGIQFFEEPADPSLITARNISLSAAVRADASVIAASDTAGQPGNNELALQLAALRSDSTTMPSGAATTSFVGYFQEIVTGVALEVSAAEDSSAVYGALANQAEARRASISGVSTDEELVHLIQFQQAYTAATRLVSTIDEMMQDVLNLV